MKRVFLGIIILFLLSGSVLGGSKAASYSDAHASYDMPSKTNELASALDHLYAMYYEDLSQREYARYVDIIASLEVSADKPFGLTLGSEWERLEQDIKNCQSLSDFLIIIDNRYVGVNEAPVGLPSYDSALDAYLTIAKDAGWANPENPTLVLNLTDDTEPLWTINAVVEGSVIFSLAIGLSEDLKATNIELSPTNTSLKSSVEISEANLSSAKSRAIEFGAKHVCLSSDFPDLVLASQWAYTGWDQEEIAMIWCSGSSGGTNGMNILPGEGREEGIIYWIGLSSGNVYLCRSAQTEADFQETIEK